VLILGDRDCYGLDEHTLPLLVKLIDSSNPDSRQFSHLGVSAYYVRSGRAIAAVERMLSQAEGLRDTDGRFAKLGIGLAHGQMIADFDWLGRVKRNFIPLGDAVNRAARGVCGAQIYREILAELNEPNA